MDFKKTETSTASIYKDKNEIIHVIMREGARMDYDDALDHYLVIKDLSGNAPVLKLIDSRADWSIHPKARRFLVGKEVKEKTIARAIVHNASLKTVLMIFFNEMNKPEVPTKIFTEYDKAYEWLLEVRQLAVGSL